MPLIGNTESLGFELVPVSPDWHTHYLPEKAAWAGTAIWVGGKNICRHVPAGSSEVENYLYIPLAPLADWIVSSFVALAFEERAARYRTTTWLHESVAKWAQTASPEGLDEDEWLDEREEWWSRHFFQAGADGAQLPNLAWTRDDEKLVLEWAPGPYEGTDVPVMLSPNGYFSLSWDKAESTLDELTARIASWLRDAGLEAAFEWASCERPLAECAVDTRHAIEFLTGRSIKDLRRLFGASEDAELLRILGITSWRYDPGESPECQILRDLSPEISNDIGEVLIHLGKATTEVAHDYTSRWHRLRELSIDAMRAASSPREAGHYSATSVRKEMGLDGKPIKDVFAFVKKCGLQHSHLDLESVSDRMVVAARESGSPASSSFKNRRTEREWGRRFEAARALGHVLLDPFRSGAIGAASGPFAQLSRAQRSGVFAAELLLPASALYKASDGRLDGAVKADAFTSLLEEYGVGAHTGAHQLFNHGWLSSEVVRDELINEFAAQ